MHSLKGKFILAVSFLIIFVLVITGVILEKQKTKELNRDIRRNAINFAELTHKTIGDGEALYRDSGFLNLKNLVKKQKEFSEDIVKIQIIAYDGTILFDDEDSESRLQNNIKETVDPYLIPLVQGRFDASKVQDAKNTTNFQEDRLLEVVYPYYDDLEAHRVSLRYLFSYKNLEARIASMRLALGVLIGIGILIGIIFAMILAGKIVKPILRLKKGAEEIAKGNFNIEVRVTTKDEVGLLTTTFNKMAVDLEVATAERVEKEKMQHELELAGNIQKDILPKKLPDIKGITVAASVTPATQVGGDVFDFITVDDDNTVFYVGDVTGHGVPAGLIVSVTNALVLEYALRGENTEEITWHTNNIVYRKTGANFFITMLIMKFNSTSGKFTYTISGHEQIVHFQASDNTVVEEKPGGMAVGIMPDVSKIAKERDFVIPENDVIVLYSDGVVEAWAPDGKTMYGLDRLKDAVKKYSHLPTAQNIHDELKKDVYAFMDGAEQQDDVTFIVVKKNASMHI